MLLLASRDPLKNIILVWTVIGIEAVRGIADDIYMVTRGYAVGPTVGWIVIHSVIIILGLLSLRQKEPKAEAPEEV